MRLPDDNQIDEKIEIPKNMFHYKKKKISIKKINVFNYLNIK